MQSDFIFKLTNDYKRHEECIKILHGFSYRVIRERKEQIKMEQAKKSEVDMNNNSLLDENGNVIDDEDGLGKKKRLAFLDLLITASGNGSVLTDEDIREEVDTFVSDLKQFLGEFQQKRNCVTVHRCSRDMIQHRLRFHGACF
jgi:cytochrome P450 family 4